LGFEITLGKKPHVYDERTILISRFMDSSFHAPARYDFDRGRFVIPIVNTTVYKCDVVCSQANQLLRFGRISQKQTIDVGANGVIARYKRLTGSKKPRDDKDRGLSVLSAMRMWHKAGWKTRGKDHKISLYGEIEPNEHAMMRMAIYLFRGLHIGLMIPPAAIKHLFWDWNGENGNEWKPGEMGVLAYCKSYDQDTYELIVWGRHIRASNRFVERYSDESWFAMEQLDYWSTQVLRLGDLYRAHPWIMDEITGEQQGGGIQE